MDNSEQYISKCARIAPIVIMAGWAALGFRRGWDYGGFQTPYIDKFFHGFGFAVFYTAPLTAPLSVYLEIWNKFRK